jgi:hypothetical protein
MLWIGLVFAIYGVWICSRPVGSKVAKRVMSRIRTPSAATAGVTLLRERQVRYQSTMDQCSWLLNQAMLLSFVLYITVFFWLCNLPIQQRPLFQGVFLRFFQQPNIILFTWAGIGAAALLARLVIRYSGMSATLTTCALQSIDVRVDVHFATACCECKGAQILVFAVVLSAAVVSFNATANYDSMNHHKSDYIENYGRAILAPLPANSLLLLKGGTICDSCTQIALTRHH